MSDLKDVYHSWKKIKPILCKTFPLNKVKDAHIYMDKGLHFGKIALTI